MLVLALARPAPIDVFSQTGELTLTKLDENGDFEWEDAVAFPPIPSGSLIGGRYADARTLADRIAAEWPTADTAQRYVVLTGGEPALQVDAALVQALRLHGFETAIETTGTLPLKTPIDWICVSPKAGAPRKVRGGNELKLVYPQPGAEPEQFLELPFQHFFLQPMDGPDAAAKTAAVVAYCKAHPQWRLSLQTHKILAIP